MHASLELACKIRLQFLADRPSFGTIIALAFGLV